MASSRPLVIVGGGLAGAASACLLARAGRPVCLIERERHAKHKVCGEFLSYEAQFYLTELGLDLTKLGATPINRVRLLRKGQSVVADLPFRGISLSRHVLDEALLHLATSLGAEVLRGHIIREIDLSGEMRLVADDIGELRPEALFLANGKHEIRGSGRKPLATTNDLIGLKSYFRLRPAQASALQQHVEIALFQGGYAGLQMVEGGLANLCLLVRRERFASVGQDWQVLLASLKQESSQLHERLLGAVEELDRPLAISRIPYGYIHRPTPGESTVLFRLGDQFAVTPSFSGDGMSIALHSAFAASAAYLAGDDAATYHRRMRREIGPQIAWARPLAAALLTDIGQAGIMALARGMPSLLRFAARMTRLPQLKSWSLPVGLSSIVD